MGCTAVVGTYVLVADVSLQRCMLHINVLMYDSHLKESSCWALLYVVVSVFSSDLSAKKDALIFVKRNMAVLVGYTYFKPI